jgi:FkbM family methyltransferase
VIDTTHRRTKGARWRDAALIAYARGLEHPFKIRIVRWLARQLAGGAIHVQYAPGAAVAIDPADYIGWAVFKTGWYEQESLALALRIMREEPGLFVDVGANFGWFTCAVGVLAESSIVSIEPDCENCVLLRRNIALNRLQNVVVFNGAAGTEFAAARIRRGAQANSGTVTVGSDEQEHCRSGDWVATIPLDMLLKRIVRPVVRPVLIKIDVEGFERQVLTGIDFSGPFRPKNILFEFDRQLCNRSWGSFAELHSFFSARGYELLDVFGKPLSGSEIIPEENVWARDARVS